MLGSFRNKDNAEKYIVNFLREQKNQELKGFLEEIQMPGKGIWYRACLGPFDSESDALQQQELMRSDGFDSVVVVLKSGEKNIFSVGMISST